MKRPNKESSILAIPNCYSLPFQLVSIYPSPWSYQLSVFLFSSFWLFFSFARPTARNAEAGLQFLLHYPLLYCRH